MGQSRQTPRVWSDAIRGSEILANWVMLGSSAVVLWLSTGVDLGGTVGALWLVENTTSVDRKLWVHHVRNSLGMGGRIADLSSPDGSETRMAHGVVSDFHREIIERRDGWFDYRLTTRPTWQVQ